MTETAISSTPSTGQSLKIGWLYGTKMNIYGDRGNVMALAVPAALFCLGCFYVCGSLEQLHGRTASERTFLGVIPMITSTNLTIQILRSVRLKRRLPSPAPKQNDAPPPSGD